MARRRGRPRTRRAPAARARRRRRGVGAPARRVDAGSIEAARRTVPCRARPRSGPTTAPTDGRRAAGGRGRRRRPRARARPRPRPRPTSALPPAWRRPGTAPTLDAGDALAGAGGLAVEAGQVRLDLLADGHDRDELPADDGPESVHGDDVAGIRDGHDGRAELAPDRHDAMAAGDGPRKEARRALIDVVAIQVDEFEVVLVGEEAHGLRIAHAVSIGTWRAQIERRQHSEWPTVRQSRGRMRPCYRDRPHASAPVGPAILARSEGMS